MPKRKNIIDEDDDGFQSIRRPDSDSTIVPIQELNLFSSVVRQASVNKTYSYSITPKNSFEVPGSAITFEIPRDTSLWLIPNSVYC